MKKITNTILKNNFDDTHFLDEEFNTIYLLQKQNEILNNQNNRLCISLIMTNIIVLFLIFSKK